MSRGLRRSGFFRRNGPRGASSGGFNAPGYGSVVPLTRPGGFQLAAGSRSGWGLPHWSSGATGYQSALRSQVWQQVKTAAKWGGQGMIFIAGASALEYSIKGLMPNSSNAEEENFLMHNDTQSMIEDYANKTSARLDNVDLNIFHYTESVRNDTLQELESTRFYLGDMLEYLIRDSTKSNYTKPQIETFQTALRNIMTQPQQSLPVPLYVTLIPVIFATIVLLYLLMKCVSQLLDRLGNRNQDISLPQPPTST
jgi:hypothetical protein